MRPTPTAAIDVILNLPPLHIYIPTCQLRGAIYRRVAKEVEEDHITDMPSDSMIPKYTFKNIYTVVQPAREDWKNGFPVMAKSYWYTDVFKTEEGVGPVYTSNKEMLPVSLSIDTTVFQTEVSAIHLCEEEIR